MEQRIGRIECIRERLLDQVQILAKMGSVYH